MEDLQASERDMVTSVYGARVSCSKVLRRHEPDVLAVVCGQCSVRAPGQARGPRRPTTPAPVTALPGAGRVVGAEAEVTQTSDLDTSPLYC